MFGKTIKKIFFKNKKVEEKPNKTAELATVLRQKSQELSQEILTKAQEFKEEILVMREKCKNLLETNYQLGLKHIDNGNISEAIFRFRFINKFWPEHQDSYYQLAYCLVLKRQIIKAKVVLEILLTKNPNHKPAQELLDLIESDLSGKIDTINQE